MSVMFNMFMTDQSVTFTAGSEQQTNGANNPSDQQPSPVVALSATKAVSFYVNTSTNILYGYVQDISGTTITNNAAGEQNLSTMEVAINAIALSSTSALVAGQGSSNNLKQITESSGALSASATSYGTNAICPLLAKLDSNYSILFWREGTTDTRAAVVSHGAPPVVGTAYTANAAQGNTAGLVALDNSYFVVAYTNTSNDLYIKVGQAVAGVITYGSAVLIATSTLMGSNSTGNNLCLSKDDSTNVTIYYKYNSSPYDIKSKAITISGTTATAGTEQTVDTVTNSTAYVPFRFIPININNGIDFLFVTDPDDNAYLKGEIVPAPGESAYTANITANNPCKPVGANYLTTDTLIVQYTKSNSGIAAPIYAKIIQVAT